MRFISHSVNDTEAFGERLARRLRPGDVVAYTGALGMGKTALTRGLALDPRDRPQSADELLAVIDREVVFSVSPVPGTGNASVSARLINEKRSPFGFLTSRRLRRPTVLG